MLLGELGMPVPQARALSWVEVDNTLHGYAVRQQKTLVGFRLVAVQVHNTVAEKPISAHEYLPLPAVDGPVALPATVEAPNDAFLARIAARLGKPVTLLT
jgi:hypothetical protein